MLCSELMLDDILNDFNRRECFKSFLKTEYTEENLEFWYSVKQYHKIENNNEKLIQCERIYNEFIVDNSNQQISIPHNIYQQIHVNFSNKQSIDTIFDEAQSLIFQLMDRDSFNRFKNSTFYSPNLFNSNIK